MPTKESDGEGTTVGGGSRITLKGLAALLGGIAAIATLLFSGIAWIHGTDVQRFEEIKAEFGRRLEKFDERAAETSTKTTELITEMRGANRRLDEVKNAVDGTSSKVIDLAQEVGTVKAKGEALEGRAIQAEARVSQLEARVSQLEARKP